MTSLIQINNLLKYSYSIQYAKLTGTSKMTEYNRETGTLTLSLADAQNFHRTADRKLGENPPIEFYVEKLKNFGYEVTNVKQDQLDVNAPEDEIFELLNGQQIYL
jgi:hypothetical protein